MPSRSDDLHLARLVACPVVVLTAAPPEGEGYLAMVSSLSYADLSPVLFATNLSKSSRTGAAILASGNLTVSIMADHHQEALRHLSNNSQPCPLSAAGFTLRKTAFAPGIDDAISVFTASVKERMPLPSSTLIVLAPLERALEGNFEQQSPLIRYNRSYRILAGEFAEAEDAYPV